MPINQKSKVCYRFGMANSFQPESFSADLRITAYGDGFVEINGQKWLQPVVLSPGLPVGLWPAPHPADIDAALLRDIRQATPEVVILGTGSRQIFLRPQLAAVLQQEGPRGEAPIGLEVMATDAACRTYNLLAAEGRRVMCVLYPPGLRPVSLTPLGDVAPPLYPPRAHSDD